MKDMKIGIVGCGNMGSAIVRGILDKAIIPADAMSLNDKDIEKAANLANQTGAHSRDLLEVVRNSDYLIIAVKPQEFEELIKDIAHEITHQTIISIMAGIKIDVLADEIGKSVPIARAMPNIGAFIAKGVTCVSFNSLVEDKDDIKGIFSGIGKVIEIEESLMDTVTAVSGSGPAYLFYFAEAMIEAAIEMGLAEDVAKELVIEKFYGSSALMKEGKDSPGELIKKVASKGGTTEAALTVFEEKGLKSIIKSAMLKAKERSEELSKG